MKNVRFFSVILALALAAASTVAFKVEDGTRPAYIDGACGAVTQVDDQCQSGNTGPQCYFSGNAWLNSGCDTALNMPHP